MLILCPQCNQERDKPAGCVNRSRAIGAPVYCGRACAGLARRLKSPPTDAEKREAKRLYDEAYRAKHLASIKAKKAAHYKVASDPEKERVYRKAHMHRHVEYCRRPEYRQWKAEYDKQLRAAEYGPFAETFLLLLDVERELRAQASSYERRKANGYYTRNAQKRRREAWLQRQKT